jgi:hypothetical protein
MADGFGEALQIRLPFFIPSGCLSPIEKVIFRLFSESLRRDLFAFKVLSRCGEPFLRDPKVSRILLPFLYAFARRISFLPHSLQ